MMEMAKVTSKGQITIPISIRRRLEINEGDKILFINKTDGVLMVNPDTVQGDLSEYTANSIPLDAAVSPAPAAQKTASSGAVASTAASTGAKPAASKQSAPEAEAPASEPADTAATTAAASAEPAKRKYIPPAEDTEQKPAAQAGGIDLSTLLDDIRSIGSNI